MGVTWQPTVNNRKKATFFFKMRTKKLGKTAPQAEELGIRYTGQEEGEKKLGEESSQQTQPYVITRLCRPYHTRQAEHTQTSRDTLLTPL